MLELVKRSSSRPCPHCVHDKGMRVVLHIRVRDLFFFFFFFLFSRVEAWDSVVNERSLALSCRLDSDGIGYGSLGPDFVPAVQVLKVEQLSVSSTVLLTPFAQSDEWMRLAEVGVGIQYSSSFVIWGSVRIKRDVKRRHQIYMVNAWECVCCIVFTAQTSADRLQQANTASAQTVLCQQRGKRSL